MYIKFNKYGQSVSISNSLPSDAKYAGNSIYFDSYGKYYFEISGDANNHAYRTDFGEIYQVGNVRIYYDYPKNYLYEISGHRFYHDNNGLIYEANGVRIYYDDYGRAYQIGSHRIYY